MDSQFKKCCFFVELRTGCLIIGYLYLVTNIAGILSSILLLAALDLVDAKGKAMKEEVHRGAILDGVMLVILSLFLAFTIVLLIGLHQHKRGYVKAFMIYMVIFISLNIIMLITNFTSSKKNTDTIVTEAISIMSMSLSIYFLLVIRSYYLKMDEPATNPEIYNTA